MASRIAILGGTFDPIHDGHIQLGREAARAFHLDRVLLVPAGNPPHKADLARTPYEHRFKMVQLACDDDPMLQPSRLEEGSEKSYTFQTLERVRSTLAPNDCLFLILGADAFADIKTWYRWTEVLAMVAFIVASRPGYSFDSPPGARVHRLDSLSMPESSSEMRRKLFAGWRPNGLPESVWKYIKDNHLYSS